jgi:hypothetical protein
MSDRPRLLARTRVARTPVAVVGGVRRLYTSRVRLANPQAAVPEGAEEAVDTELFDDGDFYHDLLRELSTAFWLCAFVCGCKDGNIQQRFHAEHPILHTMSTCLVFLNASCLIA